MCEIRRKNLGMEILVKPVFDKQVRMMVSDYVVLNHSLKPVKYIYAGIVPGIHIPVYKVQQFIAFISIKV